MNETPLSTKHLRSLYQVLGEKKMSEKAVQEQYQKLVEFIMKSDEAKSIMYTEAKNKFGDDNLWDAFMKVSEDELWGEYDMNIQARALLLIGRECNPNPTRMTPEQVTKRIAAIEEKKNDDESAHSMEDLLHEAVLQSIADDMCDDPRECARLALTTKSISFARWCA